MRFLVALASIVLGLALLAGFIYRDAPAAQMAAPTPAPAVKTATITKPARETLPPKIVAPKVVAEIADAQPTILNADRSRFESVVTAPAPEPVTKNDSARSRRILVMALQGELRRVGCYDGAVNGQWTTSSKAGMYWFLKRVNAKLPVSKPDEAQLSLLKTVDKDFCADKAAPKDFVTKVIREDVAEGVPNPTAPMQNDAFSQARARAGLPSEDRVALSGGETAPADLALPEPMAVGRVEQQEKRRRYRASSRRVQNLFKHPLGRF